MAAVEVIEYLESDDLHLQPYLRLMEGGYGTPPLRSGQPLFVRRAARQRARQRRRRTLVVLALVAGLVILAWPGHAFGGTTGAGLPTDLANSSVLASGMDYVVQVNDTVSSIARMMNPVDVATARTALINELGSTVVVPGEHILIP